MRLVSTTPTSRVFALNEKERVFFLGVLRSYPAVPDARQPLSRGSADHLDPGDEHLLHEALAEHRKGNSAKIRRWLNGGSRLKAAGGEWHFSLARKDFDWLLQVLNDVRVGHWIQLGSPDDVHDPLALLRKDPTAFIHMEAAGMFQMELLRLAKGDAD
jgi:hypothetical protein